MGNKESFFYSRVLFWGFGISLIINLTGTSFWISELLGVLLGFIILLLVKNVNSSTIFKKISGFIFAFFSAIILVNMGGTMYLRQTPNFLLATFPVLVGFMLSRLNKDGFKRTIFYMFIFSIILFLFSGAILVPNAKPLNILPFSFNLVKILQGAGVFALTSVTPVLCLNDMKDKKSILLNYGTSMITVIGISLLIVMVMGSEEAILYRYPEFVLLKRIKIYEFFSNVENLFVIMIVTDFVTTIGLGFMNMDLKGKIIPFLVVLALLLVVDMATSSSNIMTWFYFYYPYILLPLLIVTLFPKK